MQAIADTAIHALCAIKVTPERVQEWHELGAAQPGATRSSAILVVPYPQLQALFKVRRDAPPADTDLRALAANLMRQGAGLVVADEAHTIKNPKAQVSPPPLLSIQMARTLSACLQVRSAACNTSTSQCDRCADVRGNVEIRDVPPRCTHRVPAHEQPHRILPYDRVGVPWVLL